MSLWSKIRGTIENAFQIGLGGPQLKHNTGHLDARNAGDSGYVNLRVATPIENEDAVTKQYADTLNKPIVVTDQFDGNNALPSNTGVEHFITVTTTGANASIGQVLWDDGQGVGTVTVLTALDGRTIFTSQAFSGGTVTFEARAFYVWNNAGSVWELEASNTQTGAIREIRYAITNANGAQDSADKVPANAVVVSAEFNITTPYSGGATLTLGHSGNTTLLQTTTDNLSTVAGHYQVMQDTSWGGSELTVRTTVAGSPAAGAGFAIVKYTSPNN